VRRYRLFSSASAALTAVLTPADFLAMLGTPWAPSAFDFPNPSIAPLANWPIKRDLTRGISINQFIATAVAEKVAALTTVAYLESRARRGDRAAFERVLAKIPSSEPCAEDRVPEPR